MSLLCDETKQAIMFGEELMVGTRQDVPFYSALSSRAIDKIPENERRQTPCQAGEHGIDIHAAHSTEGPDGAYCLKTLALGEFVFSIALSTAKTHLPEHSKRYLQPN